LHLVGFYYKNIKPQNQGIRKMHLLGATLLVTGVSQVPRPES